MYLILGIGGTHTRIGLSIDGQSIIHSSKVYTNKNFDQAMAEIKQTVDGLGVPREIQQIVVGVAGILNQDKRSLFHSPYLPDWDNKPLSERMSQIFSAPCALHNDAELEGLAEATRGAGQTHKIVGYLVVGTGLGGARIVEGKVDQSAFGMEPGHQLLTLDEDNSIEEWEQLVSGTAIEKITGHKAKELDDPKTWELLSKRFAIGLHNTIVHWSPNIVVISGSAGKRLDLEAVKRALANPLTIYPRLPEIVFGTLGDEAALLGGLQVAT